MFYVTQGTVQIEFRKTTDIGIKINPVQDYIVKHEKQGKKQDYIVFIDDLLQGAKLFEKARTFTTTQPEFAEYLVEAAFRQIKIEIKVSFKVTKSSSLQAPVEITIESITIPAAPDPDRT